MPVIPLFACRWAILCHLSVVILIPLILLFFNIPSISGVNGGCAFKPMRSCDDHVRLILLLEYCARLMLLWTLPFSSVIITTMILQMKGRLHPFINSHAKQALKFQLKLAGYTAIIHLAISTLLIFFYHTVGLLLGHVILIVLFDYLFFPVLAIIQVWLGMAAAVKALRGQCANYPEIKLLS
jgi:uncharacterized Tic20 family protein